jgi:hypothetical protein
MKHANKVNDVFEKIPFQIPTPNEYQKTINLFLDHPNPEKQQKTTQAFPMNYTFSPNRMSYDMLDEIEMITPGN